MPNSFKEVIAPPKAGVIMEWNPDGTYNLGFSTTLTLEEFRIAGSPTGFAASEPQLTPEAARGYAETGSVWIPLTTDSEWNDDNTIVTLTAFPVNFANLPVQDGVNGITSTVYFATTFVTSPTVTPLSPPMPFNLPLPRRTINDPTADERGTAVHDFSAAPDPVPAGASLEIRGTYDISLFGLPTQPADYQVIEPADTVDVPLQDVLESLAARTANATALFLNTVENGVITFYEAKGVITHENLTATETTYSPPTP